MTERCGHCGEEFVMRGRHRYVCGCSIDRMEAKIQRLDERVKAYERWVRESPEAPRG